MQAFIGAMIFDGQTLYKDSALICEDGHITGIHTSVPKGAETRQLDGGYILPGFIDLQVNGGGGAMFNDAQTVETLHTIGQAHASLGTQLILPTLITDTPDRSQAAIDAVAQAIADGVTGIAGIHLEGPHLSKKRKGAHDASLIRPMTNDDLTMIEKAAQILPHVMLTVAPETVSLAQVTALAKAGVVVSLGHTDTNYATAMAYMQAGANCTTHLFNAMSQLGNREPGLVGATLDNGAAHAGLIADGVHVHPATIRAALAAKTGPGSIFLVTDAMSSVGSDLTEFTLNGRTVFRQDGTLRLADGTLAGADIDMATSIAFLVNDVGVPVQQALAMATSKPAQAIGLSASDWALVGRPLTKAAVLDAQFRLQPIPC